MNIEFYRSRNGQTATAVTVDEFGNPRDHGFSVGVNINISGVSGSSGPQSEADAGPVSYTHLTLPTNREV